MKVNKKYCILIIGESGTGKSTLENNLVNYTKDMEDKKINKLISYTSRPKRKGETDGDAYYFIDKSFFIDHEDEFVESIVYLNNYYGLLKDQFSEDKHITCVVEPKGCNQIINYLEESNSHIPILIYFNLPYNVRLENMKNRGDCVDNIIIRINNDIITEDFKKLDLINKIDETIIIESLTNDLHEIIFNYLFPESEISYESK